MLHGYCNRKLGLWSFWRQFGTQELVAMVGSLTSRTTFHALLLFPKSRCPTSAGNDPTYYSTLLLGFSLDLGPLYTREVSSSKKGAFSLVRGASYACLFTPCQLVFQRESLNFLPGLQHLDGTLMDPCGTPTTIYLSFLTMDFQPFFGLLCMLLCLVSVPPWFFTLSRATLHLLKTLRARLFFKLLSVSAFE